jgi:serine/threonine protein kinase
MSNADPVIRLNAALEDRYRVERELGGGCMATVYLADDVKHERKIALKVLKPELAAVVGAERFLTEIKTTANPQHPQTLPSFDSGEADSLTESPSHHDLTRRAIPCLSASLGFTIAYSAPGPVKHAS